MDRRKFLGTTGTALGSLLAGCSGSSLSAPGESSAQGYTVSMEPMGEVTIEGVPETIATYCPGYADMLVALGHADAVASVGLPSRYHTQWYDELDGVSIDKSKLTALYDGGVGKETFYAIGADLHLIDPNWLQNNFKGWEQKDVDEIASNEGPFLGNTIFRRTDGWHDYRYYTMYEAFEKVAQAVKEESRYDELASFHDEFIADVQAKLPGPDSRPNAALLWQGKNEPETFYPARLSGKGTNKKQFHDLGIADAFAPTGLDGLSTSERGTVDYETLLEVDPDSILLRGHESKSRAKFEDTVLSYMKNHDVASELTAVQNDAVYRGGPIYAGPIQNLFLTERYAKHYFPEKFPEKTLFDRQRVAEIVTGK